MLGQGAASWWRNNLERGIRGGLRIFNRCNLIVAHHVIASLAPNSAFLENSDQTFEAWAQVAALRSQKVSVHVAADAARVYNCCCLSRSAGSRLTPTATIAANLKSPISNTHVKQRTLNALQVSLPYRGVSITTLALTKRMRGLCNSTSISRDLSGVFSQIRSNFRGPAPPVKKVLTAHRHSHFTPCFIGA
jgi:hypothetical protein